MGKLIDLTGKKYNRLTVIEQKEPDKRGEIQWLCECDCGNTKIVASYNIRKGLVKSCGCYQRDRVKTHGMSKTTEYLSWQHMKDRCNNPKNKHYHNYGGRGIKVCDRWVDSFENFLEDMGKKPDNSYSIDRMDVNGNYEPDNCRWATYEEQSNNMRNTIKIDIKGQTKTLRDLSNENGIIKSCLDRRIRSGITDEKQLLFKGKLNSRYLEYNGETKTITEWAKELNISHNMLWKRIDRGWSVSRALETPSRR